MWLNLGTELINTNAVSQIVKKEVNGGYYIEFFRLDGSYMTSTVYDDQKKAEAEYTRIKNNLLYGKEDA